MTGLIWLVQLVHYPAFEDIGEWNFTSFHRDHSRKIAYIVVPVMSVELITSFILFLEDDILGLNAIGFYLVVLIWASTFMLSVPTHQVLRKGKNESSIEYLVLTNWIRTIFWTLKASISFWLLVQLVDTGV